MSLFYPYSHHQHQLLTPLTMQTYHPLGSYFRPPLFSALDNTARELERWADENRKLLSSRRQQSTAVSGPRFTIEDTDHAYLLQGEIPGMTSDDVTIDLPNTTTLSIRGYTETIQREGSVPDPATKAAESKTSETATQQSTPDTMEQSPEASQNTPTKPDQALQTSLSQPSQKPRSRYRVTHRSVSQFQRTFTLPDGIDRAAVTTTFEDGKLKIVVPKPGAPKAAVQQDVEGSREQTTEQEIESERETQIDAQTSASDGGSDAQSSASATDEGDWVDVSETKAVSNKSKGKKVQIETVDE